jgi:hypothetical protein
MLQYSQDQVMTTMAHLRPQNFMKCDISDQIEEEAVVFAHAARRQSELVEVALFSNTVRDVTL